MDEVSRQKALKYMKLAKYNADLFSKDPNRKVGTLLMKSDFSSILATGINGFPRKVNEAGERWERPTKYKYVIHSEVNAICNAARSGTSIDNSSAIVTMFPCSDCSKALIQAGVKKIYSPRPDLDDDRWGEHFKISLEMFQEVGVEVIMFEHNEV
jgi:dCMP deaminase